VFNWSTLLRPLQGSLPSWIVIPPDLALVPTEYKLTVSFIILVMTLLWRPTGIFKGAST
jgi:branched-chain amino acid transport system permease protein